MTLTIRPATSEDAEWLGANLRDEDRREVETASGLPASTVVPMSLSLARECYTIRYNTYNRIDQNPCAIFGVCDDPNQDGYGIMWLLGSRDIRRGALSLLREAPKWLDHFNRLYPNGIHNIVDTRNDLHIRWLMLMGFEFLEGVVTIRDVPFVHAFRHTPSCVTLFQ